jgi:tetrahydromethanopterin S-methyltransferase subunit F
MFTPSVRGYQSERRGGSAMNRGIIGTIIGVLVIIILVIVILQLT